MRYLKNITFGCFFLINCSTLYCETIPALCLFPRQIDEQYRLEYQGKVYIGDTLEEVCSITGFPANDLGNHGYYCGSIFNKIRVGWMLICSDGSIKNPASGTCENPPIRTCPDGSWTFDPITITCTRHSISCIPNPELVSEKKLLAAIAYGESSGLNNYEEMAAIASATVRRRDSAHKSSVNTLLKSYPNFSYAITDGNERYRALMCSETSESFEDAYKAAENALNYGFDFANGGCFWDGYDLKTSGKKHYKYKQGFRYSNPAHDIFHAPEPPHVLIHGPKGNYDNIYISTAAYGKTIFWKIDEKYLKATGALQCR